MMNRVEKFEDLQVWKEGMQLAVQLYRVLEACRNFSLRDQMLRAAVSIPSNIAEGFERGSNKDFIRFLYISKGSCSELRTQLYLATEVGIIECTLGEALIERTRKISAMLYKLIKTRSDRF